MTLVVDTGVLVAAARPRDDDHAECRQLLETANEARAVPAPALTEVEYHLRGSRAALAVVDDVVAGGLRVVDLVLDDYARVRELMETYGDLRAGFVDCAVLAVVERLGEPKLATLDRRHFSVLRPRHVDHLALLPAR